MNFKEQFSLTQGDLKMSKIANNKPMIGLAITTALAGVALTGCSTNAAPLAGKSIEKAQSALVKGNSDKAVSHAEAAVLAEPRNGSHRAMLGAAYMESGRFQSAATSFGDAMTLGSTDARTILSYALAETAIGNGRVALATLKEYRDVIDPADLGLAYALAGEPARGVHILSNALRGGQNTAKVRQNLAYAYALQGNWRAARLMAAEDVPADQINERIASWAADIGPEAYQTRVANLLGVKAKRDSGQPTRLALSNFSDTDQMVAEAAASAPAPQLAANGELPAVGAPAPAIATAPVIAPAVLAAPAPIPVPAASAEAAVEKPPVRFAAAFGSPVAKPAASTSSRYVSNPVVQNLPSNYSAAAKKAPKPAPRVAQSTPQRRMVASSATPKVESNGTHLVQLGSYNSRATAEAASKKLQQRHSTLKGRDMVITEARVKGKTYWRVAAAGFAQSSAKSACSSLKAKGQGCFAYSASRKLPGAVDRGVRIAAR